ncbi:ferritin heavy chain-like isoform X1 [Canis lupus familiaris]|uniref:ferritin heavy chain-like isoform X1 n=1 Tax=Canis lupus familiaris TaxID=9615 RepID=UPI0018F707E6|nr:ferritin heavy chain-like isoform X1 [Canis lupus familiaris]
MAFSLERDDGALRNLARFFQRQAREETQHAEMLVELQNQRGGRIRLRDVKKPDRDAWESGPRATERALHLEKRVNQSLPARPDLHRLATDQNDAQLCDFLEARSLRERASERASEARPSKSSGRLRHQPAQRGGPGSRPGRVPVRQAHPAPQPQRELTWHGHLPRAGPRATSPGRPAERACCSIALAEPSGFFLPVLP